MGTLYVVATPIGNLQDITLRAIETLKNADIILVEDTRVAKKLLSRYGIRKPVWRADAEMEMKMAPKILRKIQNGENVVFISDAGTPGISDPGSRLVKFLRNENVSIIPIPGASSLTAFLSVSGIQADQFTFLGYPPHKKGRKTFFLSLRQMSVYPIVFFESPHRLQKTLGDISNLLGADTSVIIGKELTKVYEEIWRGTAEEAKEYFVGDKLKGEFVLLIDIGVKNF